MRPNSVIDSSSKAEPAAGVTGYEEVAASAGPNRSSSSKAAGPSDQTRSTNTANGSALASDTNAPPTNAVPFVPPPPPPPLPSQLSNSSSQPTTRSVGSSVPLVPLRRPSQDPAPTSTQYQSLSSTSPAPQSNRASSTTTPRTSPYPPRQGSYGSTAPTPYGGGPTTPGSHASQAYQPISSSQVFASPAPMTSYGSPSPIPYQPPTSFSSGTSRVYSQTSGTSGLGLSSSLPPRPQRPSTSPSSQTPYSTYGTPAAPYTGQPTPLRPQRPATTGTPSAPQTPASQSMYGTSPAYAPVPQQTPVLQSIYGTSPAYGSAPQPTASRPQSYAGGPITPGAPLLPYANIPQQPVITSGPKTPSRKKTDAFVAHDPFRPQPHSKHDKPSDDLTFDDIPVPGAAVVSQSWSKYGPSPSELPTSQYPDTQPMGSVSGPTSSYPPLSGQQSQSQSQPLSSVSQPVPSWRPSQSSTSYDRPQSSTNAPLTYPSQYQQPPQPIYNRPSSTATSSMPYDGSSQYPTYSGSIRPQLSNSSGEPLGQSSSAISRPYVVHHEDVPGIVPFAGIAGSSVGTPPPVSSSDLNLNQQPTQSTLEPITEGPPTPPPRDDSERLQTPVGRLSSPGDMPPVTYAPPSPTYPTPQGLYDPNDPSTFPSTVPPSPPFSPFYPIYPPSYPPSNAAFGMYPMPKPKESIWSRVGNVFRWPFSSRRHDSYVQPYDSFASDESKSGYSALVTTFVVKTMPREVYLHFLLRLPSLYFSRVARIFEEADLTLPEIKKMALETASQGKNAQFDHIQVFESSNVPPQYERLKSTWESFIDSVMREWKTYNIISVLLLSAILTILQIQGASDDPLTRYLALFSLICALISLLFGCMYIIRFGTMRKTYKAAEWALEAKKTKTVIWWNVWVLLAMPAVWLTWSIVLYIACIMSFVWRTSAQSTNPPPNLSHGGLLAVRLIITIVLFLGVLYGCLILSTFSRYGEAMDRAWKERIDGWLEEKAGTQYFPQSIAPYPSYFEPPQFQPQFQPLYQQYPQRSETVPDYSSSAPAYTSQPYGHYPSDSKVGYTGPDYGPTYANAGYVPPPEPYDSPIQSRTGSPESTSSTLYATMTNTEFNKTSGLHRDDSIDSVIYKGPGHSIDHPLPDIPAKYTLYPNNPPYTLYPNIPPRLVPQKIPLAVPPGPNLPPIPGTPMTNRSSAGSSIRAEEGDVNPSSLTTGGKRPRDDADDGENENENETHVRFRSPLISAQGSFSFAGSSDKELEEPLLPAAEASGSSSTVRVSPVPSVHSDSGMESESLRRRRLG